MHRESFGPHGTVWLDEGEGGEWGVTPYQYTVTVFSLPAHVKTLTHSSKTDLHSDSGLLTISHVPIYYYMKY